MKTLRVLIVDDSPFNRRTIAELLSRLPGVEIVGKASDGDEGLRLAASLEPDLITLDLEMPRMDGFTFLRLLMARAPVPVIVVSGYSQKENVFRALELGALDFVSKPTRTTTGDLTVIEEELARKVQMVRQLSPAVLEPARRPAPSFPSAPSAPSAAAFGPSPNPKRRDRAEPTQKIPAIAPPRPLAKIVLVGASTGGPTALLEFFQRMPPGAAVVVAQHMPERFTKTFAERLDRTGPLRVREATDLHLLEPGNAYVCPGGRCVEVATADERSFVRVVEPSGDDRYVPSVDRLFASAARTIGSKAVAVVLTGMGDDGARGVTAVKEAGGLVIAESPESAVIYGMPGAAARTGNVDRSLPLGALSAYVADLVR